jgi:hypothetical protein
MSVLFFPANKNHFDLFFSLEKSLGDLDIEYSYLVLDKDLSESKSFSSINYLDVRLKKVLGERSKLLKKLYLVVFSIIFKSSFLRVLSNLKTKVLVVGNDGSSFYRVFCYYARKRGIKVILLQDGNYNGLENNSQNRLSLFLSDSSLFGPFATGLFGTMSDFVCVYGENIKLKLQKYLTSTRVVVTGSPRHRAIRDRYNSFKSEEARMQNSINVLICTSNYKNCYLFDYHREQMELMKSTLNLLNGKFGEIMQVTLRIHPREDRKEYESFVSDFDCSFSHNRDIALDLHNANIVFTFGSTVFLDSAVCGKLCYQVAFSTGLQRYLGRTFPHITNQEDLNHTVENLTHRPNLEWDSQMTRELADIDPNHDSIKEVAKLISQNL